MAGEVSKKILWIFVFLILAAIAILGVLFIRGYQAGRQVTAIEATPEPAATANGASNLTITLLEPANDIATTSARTVITGKTAAEAFVAVTGGSEDAIVVSDSSGNFT